jgi:hypothetical protein
MNRGKLGAPLFTVGIIHPTTSMEPGHSSCTEYYMLLNAPDHVQTLQGSFNMVLEAYVSICVTLASNVSQQSTENPRPTFLNAKGSWW